MPNWAYLVVSLFYNLGLATWIGGGVALGAIAAPLAFRTLERRVAGELFGPIFRRFSRLRLMALVVAIAAAAIKFVTWETHADGIRYGSWVAVRWAALAFMAAAVLYEILVIQPSMERQRPGLQDAGDDPDHPIRTGFNALHKRAEVLTRASLLAAVVAMFFN